MNELSKLKFGSEQMRLEKEKQLFHLYDLSKEIRGSFLDQAIAIEMLITDIISRHFCPEEARRSLFFSLVPPELTFSTKIRILETILELCYPDLLEKYPTLIKEIKKIKNFRNRVAHSMLDTTEEFLKKKYNDRIGLESYKKGRKRYLILTVGEKQERLKACTPVVRALIDVQNEVIQRVQAKKE